MPNWCSNVLLVTGDPGDVLTFAAAVRGTGENDGENAGDPLSFQSIKPCPTRLLDTISGSIRDEAHARQRADNTAEYGYPTWYEWKRDHWGTKWDASDPTVEHGYVNDKLTLRYVFDTAWSPPRAVIDTAAEQWPQLTFTLAYDEPGLDFGGYVIWRNGERESEDAGGSKQDQWDSVAERHLEDVL